MSAPFTAEIFVTFLLFFGAMALASVFFIGWLVYLVGKFGLWLVGLVTGSSRRTVLARPCPHRGCQASNPIQANYCRRCGRSLRETASRSYGSAAAA